MSYYIKKNNIIKQIFLTILGVFVMIPFYYLLVTTFKSPDFAATNPLALPREFAIENYINAWNAMNYPNVLKNNLLITCGSLILLTLISSFAAYPLGRRKNKANNAILGIFLAGLMVPSQVNIIPLFRIMKALGLVNSIPGIILIYSITFMPFAVFIFHGFIRGIPIEIEQAARIDGCNVFQSFRYIMMPLLKPATATVIILSGLNIWNDFIFPLLFLQRRNNATILLEVYRNVGQFSVDWTNMFPMLVLGMLPIFIFYLLMQKQIIRGISVGAVKG